MDYEAIPVSPATLCTTHLTADKRSAISVYLKLAPELREKHGKKPIYTPLEVREVIARKGLSFEYITWAFVIYCGPTLFQQVHAAQGQDVNYVALRGAVAGTFFSGDAHFDATGFSATADSPVLDGVFGTPTDVDVSGLIGW